MSRARGLFSSVGDFIERFTMPGGEKTRKEPEDKTKSGWDSEDNSRDLFVNCQEYGSTDNAIYETDGDVGYQQYSTIGSNQTWIGSRPMAISIDPHAVIDQSYTFHLEDGNEITVRNRSVGNDIIEIDIDTNTYDTVVEPGKIIIRRRFDEENNTGHNDG